MAVRNTDFGTRLLRSESQPLYLEAEWLWKLLNFTFSSISSSVTWKWNTDKTNPGNAIHIKSHKELSTLETPFSTPKQGSSARTCWCHSHCVGTLDTHSHLCYLDSLKQWKPHQEVTEPKHRIKKLSKIQGKQSSFPYQNICSDLPDALGLAVIFSICSTIHSAFTSTDGNLSYCELAMVKTGPEEGHSYFRIKTNDHLISTKKNWKVVSWAGVGSGCDFGGNSVQRVKLFQGKPCVPHWMTPWSCFPWESSLVWGPPLHMPPWCQAWRGPCHSAGRLPFALCFLVSGRRWALSSLPDPPGAPRAFLSQYCFRKVCVKRETLVFNSIHHCQPLFPLYPNSLVRLRKAE